METTQSFRLAGSTDIVKITCDQEDGQNVIYWDDITDIFPGAQYVKNGDVAVKKRRNSGPDRDQAKRIKHHPGVVLDVVLSTRLVDDPTEYQLKPPRPPSTTIQASDSTGAAPDSSTNESVVDNARVSTLDSDTHMGSHDDCHTSSSSVPALTSSSLNIKEDSAMLLLKQMMELDQKHALRSTFGQRLVSFLPRDVQTQVIGSSDAHGGSVQAIQNGLVDGQNEQSMAWLQDLKDGMLKINELTSSNKESTAHVIKMQEAFNVKQDEMKQLQIQTLDQLALLQNSVQALMTQTYELHEYPIPRLFVVLPQVTSSWNPADIVSNKFRLYFL
ncbi:hypothetical protein BGX31_011212, partial [Mortierella sp. GBA43]